jgi:hypothetical protein
LATKDQLKEQGDMMLEISPSIKQIDATDIADNLLYYHYNTTFLRSLIRKGVDQDDPVYISSYRSFEGQVYENFLYEKLLRYAEANPFITYFILKGIHQDEGNAKPNTLSINNKEQIVYRTHSREIGEFDALFVTKENELYFVEMSLTQSVTKLRERLRKKHALLEIIFPHYTIKALIILNKGATGTKQFPDYAQVWLTDKFYASDVIAVDYDERNIQPKKTDWSSKMVAVETLLVHPFKYYPTIAWITKMLRAHQRHLVDMKFLMQEKTQRYMNLYNKFYLGFLTIKSAKNMLQLSDDYRENQRVMVAIEKKFNNEMILTYYIHKSRKKLMLYYFDDDNNLVVKKKDPYGITITEITHINKQMNDSYILTMQNIKTIKQLLRVTKP